MIMAFVAMAIYRTQAEMPKPTNFNENNYNGYTTNNYNETQPMMQYNTARNDELNPIIDDNYNKTGYNYDDYQTNTKMNDTYMIKGDMADQDMNFEANGGNDYI